MSKKPKNTFTREQAESLLDGTSATHPELASLLSAARSSAGVSPSGEAEALTAFRRAHGFARPQAGRRPGMKTAVAAALSTKLLVAGVAVAATGGVALAASLGTLPGIDSPGTHHAPAARTSDPNARPSAGFAGLCLAWRTGAKDDEGRAGANPAFTTLITAAGGTSNVDGFCNRVVASTQSRPTPGGVSSPRPTTSSRKPAAVPTGSPSDVPGGRPSDVPSKRPTSTPAPQPAGAPTYRPAGAAVGHPSERR